MFSKRSKELAFVCFCFFVLLLARLVHISVQKGKTYETMAQNQQTRQITVKNIRADITDKNGTKLTDELKEPMYLTDKGSISAKKDGTKYAFQLERRFPEIAHHVVGYTSSEGEGISGIEKHFDFVLKNKGKVLLSYMADAMGTPVNFFEITGKTQGSKAKVSLTLDSNIQKIAEDVMNKHIKSGAAVILDCKTFDVLAMVSRPDFDDADMESYKTSSRGELLNRALMGYNAGSVFKIVTASAALEKDSSYLQRYFNCLGRYELPDGSVFRCHEENGHGVMSFDDSFAFSCNCSFYLTGLEVGAASIVEAAKKFGIGSALLNLEFEENAGNLPQKQEYTPGDSLNLAIGQGEILLTPLQCAVMAATIANDGLRRDVNLVSDYSDESGNVHSLRSNNSFRAIQQSTALVISQMMRECVLHGTAKNALGSSVSIAGKTGSAESGWLKDGTTLVHGWFCGFFPYENPKYAMAILCEGGMSGAESCVTPFVEIAEKINKIYPLKQ